MPKKESSNDKINMKHVIIQMDGDKPKILADHPMYKIPENGIFNVIEDARKSLSLVKASHPKMDFIVSTMMAR